MSDQTQANAYLKTKVMTARPEQLRLMLLDATLKACRQAQEAMSREDYTTSADSLGHAREIVIELVRTINPEHDPELAARVRDLYLYFYKELAQASLRKDPAVLAGVIKLLEYERETWMQLIEKLRVEQNAGGATPNDQAKQASQTPAATGKPVVNNAASAYAAGGSNAPLSIEA